MCESNSKQQLARDGLHRALAHSNLCRAEQLATFESELREGTSRAVSYSKAAISKGLQRHQLLKVKRCQRVARAVCTSFGRLMQRNPAKGQSNESKPTHISREAVGPCPCQRGLSTPVASLVHGTEVISAAESYTKCRARENICLFASIKSRTL